MQLLFEISIILGIGIACLYFILIVFLKQGWTKTAVFNNDSKINSGMISVVIAARNEEQCILNLLQSLISQDLSKALYEIIIVDDWSDDATFALAVDFAVNHSQYPIRVFSLSAGAPEIKGKKHALQLGYQLANGEIIVTTDVDCIVTSRWLSTIQTWFASRDAVMALMPVKYHSSNSFFKQWQNLELCSLMGVAAGSAYWGRPVLCNGANLAFRKSILQALNNDFLNSKFSSGDDVFMLQAVQQRYKGKIAFLKSADVVVKTNEAVSLGQFLNQRLRWVSKNKAYKDYNIIAMGLVVWMMQLFIFAFLFLGFWNFYFLITGISIFILKNSIDFIFIKSIADFFKIKFQFWVWPVFQFLYVLYVLSITVLSFFSKFTWKGRRYRH